ncbi:hypothetical protein BDN71DRAFT_508922 [Pleurotus eryngii]|uniref:Uncharacterized protein n=1 Tax=Pleurotus eryngii TaxID=5323 RepID=A0A9P6A8C3_PLEER|nr:hypothetical protein BDN71DRAFT_508922 [Pleurotus eryngii]
MSFKIAYAPQVASLASQHHASDYYRAKYGPKGYPVPYVPFSVNLPDQFRDLRRRQESYGLSNTTSWWTCDASMSTADGEQVLAASESTNIGPNVELEQELSAAMDSPLQSNAHTAAPRSELNTSKPSIKTSSTHPLNVSCIIPSELIALISSHFVVASPSNSVPVLLELPPPFHLDRLVSSHPPCHAQDQAQTSMGPPNHQIAPSRLPVTSPVPVHHHTQSASRPKIHARTRSSMSQAMQAAINTSLAIFSAEKPAINCRPPLSPIPPGTSVRIPETSVRITGTAVHSTPRPCPRSPQEPRFTQRPHTLSRIPTAAPVVRHCRQYPIAGLLEGAPFYSNAPTTLRYLLRCRFLSKPNQLQTLTRG